MYKSGVMGTNEEWDKFNDMLALEGLELFYLQ